MEGKSMSPDRIPDLFEAASKADAAYWSLEDRDSDVGAARFRATKEASQKLEQARRAASAEFGFSRGWHMGEVFSVEQLREARGRRNELDCLLDPWHRDPVAHSDYFHKDGCPVAAVIHTAATWKDCVAFASENGLRVDVLPASWHRPRLLAVCYSRHRKN
jgi:hypothetical protein